MSYSHEAICKYLNWTAYTRRITGWFFPQHVLLQLCRKRWWGHLHVNLQTEPVIHQHFFNKELFPNRPSSLNIFSCNAVLKGQPGPSPLPEYQVVRVCAASTHLQPVPCHTWASIPWAASFHTPHSWKVHQKCQRFHKKCPQMWQGVSSWWEK